MEFIYLIIGVLLGGGIGWFVAKSKYQQPSSITKEELERMQERITVLQTDAAKLGEGKLHIETALIQTKTDLETERRKSEELARQFTQAVTDNKNLVQRLEEQRQESEEMNKRLTSEFRNIAGIILEEKTKKFTEQNKEHLDVILSPLKEKLDEFKKRVEETYDKGSRETFSLKEEVRKLQELNIRMSEETINLTKALKGDTKKQGNWGELVLEKILERSGLEKDREYKAQVVTQNVEGETIKPDFVVYLPENKHIIIDSKVSLTAYEMLVNAETDDERELRKKEHVASLRSHIKLLGEKNYQSAELFNSPEFVLMFVPIESSFGIAVQADQELFNYAWERKIVVVSPSTLLATLGTIASIWKQEKQTRNAIDIAKQGGALYDKFVGFVTDLTEVGKKMDSAKDSYKDAMSKLVEGRGNIVRSIENLKTLGAKTSKAIDQKFLDRSDEP
ncbi:MAG: DNA recombination protein RmuC [Bacteroidota bacterium]